MMDLKRHTNSTEAQSNNAWMASLSEHTSDDFSTLVLDHFGHIRSCGASAASMFRISQSRLVGMSAADLILDLFESSAPRSYRARQLGNLARDSSWQPHQMTDADGHCYAVELCLSSVVADGQEIFLAHLHRVGELATE